MRRKVCGGMNKKRKWEGWRRGGEEEADGGMEGWVGGVGEDRIEDGIKGWRGAHMQEFPKAAVSHSCWE